MRKESASVIEDKLFTKDIVFAILTRKKEVKRTRIILAKLMELYSMEMYTSIVENRIMQSDSIDWDIEKEHVVLDLFERNLLLDEVALHRYGDILEGYIEGSKYEHLLDYIDSLERLRRLNNQALAMYQEKSLKMMYHTIKANKKYKNEFPDEYKTICKWCRLEMLSRTQLPKIYYFFKEFPNLLKCVYLRLVVIKVYKKLKAENSIS